VGLLCTAGLLNGVFGEGDQLHIAHWRSVKFVDHWEEEEGGDANSSRSRALLTRTDTDLCEWRDANPDAREGEIMKSEGRSFVGLLNNMFVLRFTW